MDENKIVQVEIVQGDIEHRLPIGEFIDRLIAELRPINYKSRLFSTKGTVDPEAMEKEQRSAIDRVIQRIRDEKAS